MDNKLNQRKFKFYFTALVLSFIALFYFGDKFFPVFAEMLWPICVGFSGGLAAEYKWNKTDG